MVYSTFPNHESNLAKSLSFAMSASDLIEEPACGNEAGPTNADCITGYVVGMIGNPNVTDFVEMNRHVAKGDRLHYTHRLLFST